MLQRRPNTFAQTNLLPHFSLATKRRTIHSGLPTIRPEKSSVAFSNSSLSAGVLRSEARHRLQRIPDRWSCLGQSGGT